MAQIALAWLLQKPGITSPIIGATKPEQLSDAIAALDLSLSAEEVGALEALYQPHPVVGVYAPPAPDGKVSLTEEGMSA